MLVEKDIESALVRAVGKTGGLCLKFVSPGWSGAPDRICLFPGGRIIFAEVKKPGGKARPLQVRRAVQLRRLGFEAVVLDSKEGVRGLIEQSGGGNGKQTGGGGVDDEA